MADLRNLRRLATQAADQTLFSLHRQNAATELRDALNAADVLAIVQRLTDLEDRLVAAADLLDWGAEGLRDPRGKARLRAGCDEIRAFLDPMQGE